MKNKKKKIDLPYQIWKKGFSKKFRIVKSKKLFEISRNNHNVARAMVAKGMLNNKKLYDAYMKIDDLADFFGSLPPELSQLRNKMDEKYLKKGLAKMYSNWQDLWNEL